MEDIIPVLVTVGGLLLILGVTIWLELQKWPRFLGWKNDLESPYN